MKRKFLYCVPIIVVGIVLVFNLTTSLRAVPERPSTQKEWVYRVESLRASDIEETLNESVELGYELVSIHYMGMGNRSLIVFKAPKK